MSQPSAWPCIRSCYAARSSLTEGLRRAICGGGAINFSTTAYSQPGSFGKVFSVDAKVGERRLRFEVGQLAQQADGSCVVKYGGTYVLATAVCGNSLVPGADGTLLQVDYRERSASAGRIPSQPLRREAAFSDREVLCARAIDRALRPLFPPGFLYEAHVWGQVLCYEEDHDPDVAALNACSAALMLSGIPWRGPVGAVRVGMLGNEVVINPSRHQLEVSSLNLLYAATADGPVMVEGAANQLAPPVLARAMREAHQQVVLHLLQPQHDLARGVSVRPMPLAGCPPEIMNFLRDEAQPRYLELFRKGQKLTKSDRAAALSRIAREVKAALSERYMVETDQVPPTLASCPPEDPITESKVEEGLLAVQKEVVSDLALNEGRRLDGRGLREVRPLRAQMDYLEVGTVHGSALFDRGETQALASVSVGSHLDALNVELMTGRQEKPVMLHYHFPPFAVNEVGRAGAPNRRELGHGNLAESAIWCVMPQVQTVAGIPGGALTPGKGDLVKMKDEEDVFPFTTRIVVDTLSSSGSSSMAAVCAASLALESAGVPIRDLVAGVSIGLVTERHASNTAVASPIMGSSQSQNSQWGRYALLTDIQGMEDALGSMDCKVAGTRSGVTAIQLDIKLPYIPQEVLEAAIERACEAHGVILEVMEAAREQQQRPEELCPAIGTLTINKELVPRLIGLNGSKVDAVMERSGAVLIVNDTGDVDIYGPTARRYAAALEAVRDVEGSNIKAGESYLVKVVSVKDVGAHVELPNGVQGYLHISEISHHKLQGITDVISEGQQLEVMCVGRDPKGMVLVSRKALLPKEEVPDTPIAGGRGRRKLSSSSPLGRASPDHHRAPPVADALGQGPFDRGLGRVQHLPQAHHLPRVSELQPLDEKSTMTDIHTGGNDSVTSVAVASNQLPLKPVALPLVNDLEALGVEEYDVSDSSSDSQFTDMTTSDEDVFQDDDGPASSLPNMPILLPPTQDGTSQAPRGRSSSGTAGGVIKLPRKLRFDSCTAGLQGAADGDLEEKGPS